MKQLALLAITLLALVGCQDVVDLDLDQGPRRMIINGRVTDSLPVYADVHVTADYLSEVPNPAISDAVVELYENDILVATLQEVDTAKGYYTHPFKGTQGNNYHIKVSIPEGHSYFPGTTWISEKEEMKRVPPIDSSYFRFYEQQGFFDEGYYVFAMFTEPAGKGDHYRFRVWEDDSLYNTSQDLLFFNDDFVDGDTLNDRDIPAANFAFTEELGPTFTLELSSTTTEMFEFLTILSEQTNQVGGTFDPPPAPIIGNIYRQGNREEFGLGFFSASKLSFVEVEVVE